MKIQKIILGITSGTIPYFGHREHVALCIHSAKTSKNVEELMGKMRCSLIGFRSRFTPDYTNEKCTYKYHETKTWCWCNLVFNFLKENPTLGLDQLYEKAEKIGMLNQSYLQNYYNKKLFETEKSHYVICT